MSLEKTNFVKCDPADQVVFIIFFELSEDCLRQVFVENNNFSISGWFCERIEKTVRELKASYIVEKFQAHYMQHLDITHTLSEDLLQTQKLQKIFSERFG